MNGRKTSLFKLTCGPHELSYKKSDKIRNISRVNAHISYFINIFVISMVTAINGQTFFFGSQLIKPGVVLGKTFPSVYCYIS